MHRLAVWVCCLTLLGCQARPEPQAHQYVELQVGTVTTKVTVVQGARPPTTLAYTTDSSDRTASYASKTEHDCFARTSTLKYLAVFDASMKLVQETEVDVELDIDAGSIGEAELVLACGTQVNIKGLV